MQHSSSFVKSRKKVVGVVRGNYDGSRAMIHQLSVHPSYQRQGLGKALVKEIVDRFQKIGAPTVSVAVTDKSLKFWKKVGFKKTKIFLVGNWWLSSSPSFEQLGK